MASEALLRQGACDRMASGMPAQAAVVPFRARGRADGDCERPEAAEQPVTRLRQLGAEALSTNELLAILLGSEECAAELFVRAGSVQELSRMDALVLERGGLSAARAARVMAALELGKRAMAPAAKRPRIESPEQAAALLLPMYQHKDREHFGVLLLGARSDLLAHRLVAIGSANASLVHAREVLRPALEARCVRILLFHNHPSGDPTPSPEDIALTRRLVDVGQMIGIEVIDHIILGDGRYHSVREAGGWPRAA